MSHQYSFERLEVWKLSIELSKFIYETSKAFPDSEKFGLTNQIRRASVSVASNIAEGSARFSKRDQSRFYEIAFGSLMEVANDLILAQELQFITKDTADSIRPIINEIANKINALRKSRIR